MSQPVIEKVIDNLKTAINAHTDFTAYRSSVSDFADVPIEADTIIISQESISLEEMAASHSTIAWKAKVILEGYVPDTDDSTAIDSVINDKVSALIKQIMLDPTRGSNALDTLPSDIDIFHTPENITGFDLTIEIHFRTQINDPYTGA